MGYTSLKFSQSKTGNKGQVRYGPTYALHRKGLAERKANKVRIRKIKAELVKLFTEILEGGVTT